MSDSPPRSKSPRYRSRDYSRDHDNNHDLNAATITIHIDRQKTTPFLLNFCYRSSGFHNLSDFPIPTPSNPHPHLPAHLQIYTWMSCTLRELAHLLTGALPHILPDPVIGTRLAFRQVYPDTSSSVRSQGFARAEGRLVDDSGSYGGLRARYLCKEMGSVVVSAPRDQDQDEEMNGGTTRNGRTSGGLNLTGDDADKTLADSKFVIGDYIDCAVFPPLSDGSVVPRSAIGGRPSISAGRENGYGSRSRGGGSYGLSSRGGRSDYGTAAGSGMPSGDWRRGERPPDSGGYRSGGYGGRGGGRSRPY